MKTILHIGAHRTGTTTFQSYLEHNRRVLRAQGIAAWGPSVTRTGLFSGVSQRTPMARNSAMGRARGRLALQRQKLQQLTGAHTLLVSDENIIGSMSHNLKTATLYDDAGERLARFVAAFGGAVDMVVISMRSLDHFWASSAAHMVARGFLVPGRSKCTSIARGARSWRDVISDVACAAPGARIIVQPFERYMGQPDAQLGAILGRRVPRDTLFEWRNRRPKLHRLRAALAERGGCDTDPLDPQERWTPFQQAEIAALSETYADDMLWLIAGADGLATLTEDLDRKEAQRPAAPWTRGQDNEFEERRMAQPR